MKSYDPSLAFKISLALALLQRASCSSKRPRSSGASLPLGEISRDLHRTQTVKEDAAATQFIKDGDHFGPFWVVGGVYESKNIQKLKAYGLWTIMDLLVFYDRLVSSQYAIFSQAVGVDFYHLQMSQQCQ